MNKFEHVPRDPVQRDPSSARLGTELGGGEVAGVQPRSCIETPVLVDRWISHD